MVIDSLFQKRSQNLQIYLQIYVRPPPRFGKVGWSEQLVMVSEIARLPVHVEDEP